MSVESSAYTRLARRNEAGFMLTVLLGVFIELRSISPLFMYFSTPFASSCLAV
jgi:hypothetical protein